MALPECISRICEKMTDSGWKETYTETNPATVYRQLANTFIAKYVHKVPAIKRIKEIRRYDGFSTFIVYNDYGSVKTRETYTILR